MRGVAAPVASKLLPIGGISGLLGDWTHRLVGAMCQRSRLARGLGCARGPEDTAPLQRPDIFGQASALLPAAPIELGSPVAA